ncbi:Protein MCM10-like protein [Frankliniella fusca]|uniref:Protein MCM10-like protein n=1 Tax=Frankliniella fusca TaxID=407009 RepID=A0AAE1LH61_9NEOP|nr:Protein MCM10-like protein [Frankliniella fusca]
MENCFHGEDRQVPNGIGHPMERQPFHEVLSHGKNFSMEPLPMSQPDLPYQPTPERRQPLRNGEPVLVTHDAESYFLQPPSPHVPQIIGICNEEWRFYYFRNSKFTKFPMLRVT